jgi:MFS family permease
VLLATQGTLGLGAVIAAVLTLRGELQVWHLVAIGAMQGTAFSFNMPARQAYIADLVERPILGNAVALNNAGMNFCRIAGPAMAGAMLAVPRVGVGGVFVAMAAMYGAVLVSLLRLPERPIGGPTIEKARPRPASGRDQMLEGLHYIRTSPVLLGLLGSAFLALFFGMPYQTLMPLFAERVFEVGAGGLGALMAATGVGALVGSLGIAAFSQARNLARVQAGLGIGFGLALTGFALAPSFPWAVGALLLVGLLSSAYTALNSTLILANTEPRLYGRVMSVYLLTFATIPLGAMPMAWFADHVGGRWTVAVAGLIVALAVGGLSLLRSLQRPAGSAANAHD